MTFKKLNTLIQKRFLKLCTTGILFRSELTGQQVWDTYIKGFLPEENPVFRDPNSSYHNCNNDNNFIRRYGNIVAIDKDYNIMSMFDINVVGTNYERTIGNLSKELRNHYIKEVFIESFTDLMILPYEKCNKNTELFQLGMKKTFKRYTNDEVNKFGVVNTTDTYTFDHFHVFLPKQYVDFSKKSVEAIMGEHRDNKNVFQRTMETIPLDTLNLVRDLINQGSLLDGTTHLHKLDKIIPSKNYYDNLNPLLRDNWCWKISNKFPLAKFRNELIGVLCTELAEGEELNKAVLNWNKRVDPANYMKAVAPITKRQIEEARKFVEDNGYTESFNRRFATIDDIKVSEILHSNVGDGKIKNVSIFDNVKATSTRHKRSEFDGVEEVTIDKFMSDILPTCTSVEAFLTNTQEGNLVSLTTANDKNSKPIFKWDNNYSWTFNGNLTGKSQIKEAIKSRGGKTEGVLNIRLAFPNTTDDYDLHVSEPNNGHIHYGNVRSPQFSSGVLDLDAEGVDGHQPPEKRVENIIYTDINKMPNGSYRIWVHNYSRRGLKTNFIIEIELDGDITTLEMNKVINTSNEINIGFINKSGNVLSFTAGDSMKIINSNTVSKEIYGLQTNEFHKVNLICLTPNHWGTNNIGNKHYLFMLDKCKSPDPIRSFHNENLIPELANHRKVLDTLAMTAMIDSTDKQLSGLGFNSTVRDELIVKLSGSHKRVVKIKF